MVLLIYFPHVVGTILRSVIVSNYAIASPIQEFLDVNSFSTTSKKQKYLNHFDKSFNFNNDVETV